MINNSNTNKQKRRNKHVKLLRDSSNNNQFPSNNELKLTIRNNNTLHTSNNNKMLYLFDDSNIIYNKNNINPNLNANIMNNSSKLITLLIRLVPRDSIREGISLLVLMSSNSSNKLLVFFCILLSVKIFNLFNIVFITLTQILVNYFNDLSSDFNFCPCTSAFT